ncbi:MAG TPA: hypothetical protein VM364_01565 [Vicinamibacterales bacterium]|nr:hypothetical protein [Vicinamibacterales bacterium]
MRRVIVSALALALLPAAVFAQDPQQPPAQQQPAAPAQPKEPKLTFSGSAGLLLVQIKPDQTAAFEEMIAKLREAAAASSDASAQQAMNSMKIYKAAEAMGANALYVVMVDPVTPNGEYAFFELLARVMTPEQLRDPANQEMFKRWADAFATGPNRLNLTPVGGRM